MKWYKSTSNSSYTIDGRIIPPANQEKWLCENDDSIERHAVIRSLIKSGDVIVQSKEPKSMADAVKNNDAARLKLENERLKESLEKAKIDNDIERSRAVEEATRKASEQAQKDAARIAELEKQIASLKEGTKAKGKETAKSKE